MAVHGAEAEVVGLVGCLYECLSFSLHRESFAQLPSTLPTTTTEHLLSPQLPATTCILLSFW